MSQDNVEIAGRMVQKAAMLTALPVILLTIAAGRLRWRRQQGKQLAARRPKPG